MCGITGIYKLAKGKQPAVDSKKIIKKMTDTLIRRGPDDEGYFIDKNIALGHRRLSIIDLSKAGHQPMEYGHLIIAYNGEIYNYLEIRQELVAKGYRFKTKTDTEVILASYQAWGEKCLQKFNGMWAFAIYDTKNNELFCARDRLGVKPFYYYQDREKFVFASEPKAILAHPEIKAEANDQVIFDYLVYGMLDHQKETFFKGIRELRGGCYLKIVNCKLKIKRYWDLAKIKEMKITDREAATRFSQLLTDSVKLRLRSDVPVGTCLSGGLDSSAIVCIANQFLRQDGVSQLGRHQRTFSAVYEDRMIDESKFINIVLKKTGAQKNFTYPNTDNLSRELGRLIYAQDFPFGSTSIYAQWCVFKKAYEKHQKVMLDGQGADELLAGYHTFFPVFFQTLKEQRHYGRLIHEIIDFYRLHHASLKRIFFNRFLPGEVWRFLRNTQKNKISFRNAYFQSYYDYSVFKEEWINKYQLPVLPRPNTNPFKDQSFNLLANQGLPSLLRYEDRNSMAFSIESRTPYLDYRLVELGYALADNQKIRHGQTKWVMRQALKDILPEEIRLRQDKIGFATPEKTWLKTKLAPEMKKVFASKSFGERSYINQEKVLDSFNRFQNGEPILYQLFWRLYNVELWMRKFID